MRLRANFVDGLVENDPLTNIGTTLTSAGLVDLPAVVAPDVAAITLDPGEAYGSPEIVYVTAHVGGAASATILRAQEGTIAREHPLGTKWAHVPTAADFDNVEATSAHYKGTGVAGSIPNPARPVTIHYQGHTNYAVNPNPEINTDGWVQQVGSGTFGRTTDPAKVSYGTAAFVLTAPTNAPSVVGMELVDRIPVAPGERWVFSATIGASAVPRTVRLSIVPYDAAGVQLSALTYNITILGTQRYQTSYVMPANAATAQFRINNAATTTEGAFDMYINAIQIEKSSFATPYFDGNYGLGFYWEGTAYASRSISRGGITLEGSSGNFNLAGTLYATAGVRVGTHWNQVLLDGTNSRIYIDRRNTTPGNSGLVIWQSAAESGPFINLRNEADQALLQISNAGVLTTWGGTLIVQGGVTNPTQTEIKATSIEIGKGRTDTGAAYIDFHSESGKDYTARIISWNDGGLDIVANHVNRGLYLDTGTSLKSDMMRANQINTNVSESTSSTGYTQLTTHQEINFKVPSSEKVVIIAEAWISASGSTEGYACYGLWDTSVSDWAVNPADEFAAIHGGAYASKAVSVRIHTLTGRAGRTINIAPRYRSSNGNSVTFSQRKFTVIPST